MNKLHRTCILQLQQLLLNTEIDELIQASDSCLQINFIICAPARIAVSIFPIHPSHAHQSYLWDPNTHTILPSLPITITPHIECKLFPSSPSPRTPHSGSRIQFCRSIPSTTHTATPVSAVTSSTNPQFFSIKKRDTRVGSECRCCRSIGFVWYDSRESATPTRPYSNGKSPYQIKLQGNASPKCDIGF